MVAHQQAVAAIVAGDPNVDGVHVVGRAAGRRRHQRTRAACSSASSRATSASCAPTRSSASCSRKLAQVPGIRVFLQNPPPISIGGAHVEEPVPVHAAGHRPRRALRSAADAARGAAAGPARAAGRDQRPADQEPAGARRHRPRPGRRARRHRRADRAGALQRLRLAPGLDDLHAEQPVLGDPGAAAGVPARPRRAAAALRALVDAATLVPLGAVARLSTGHRAAHGEPLGPAARGDALVQPQAGRRRSATRSAQVQARGARDAAVRRHDRASPARRRRSRPASRACCCCSSSPSS